MAVKSETSGDAVAPSWSELLTACDDYARQAGWRYVEHDFMKLNAVSYTHLTLPTICSV